MKSLNIGGKMIQAFTRILEPYKDTQELTGFQWIFSLFSGTKESRRISVMPGIPEVVERAEDGTPILWNVPVTVELVTPKKGVTDTEHRELVATVAEALYDGSDTCAALNTAMAGEGFNAMHWSLGNGPEDEIDDQARQSRLTGVLMMRPFAPA